MKTLSALSVVVLLWCSPAPASGGPVTQDACPGTASVSVFAQLGNETLENLLFAYGSLWVSNGPRSSVLRLDPSGAQTGALTGIPSPGGLALGQDGLIYAGWGNSVGNAIGRTGAAKVVRFDAADPNGSLETYAEGFNMPNGMTFSPDGDLYVSNDFDYGLVKIPSDDPENWSVFADVWGTNGLVVDPSGRDLYAAVTFDQRSPIERVPLDDPSGHETFVQLSFGAASLEPAVYANGDPQAPLLGVKGLDDMTRDDAGNLYVVANGTGELIKVAPDGSACLVANGLQNPSSVRIAPSGSGFDDGDTTFYVTEFSGAILSVVYSAG